MPWLLELAVAADSRWSLCQVPDYGTVEFDPSFDRTETLELNADIGQFNEKTGKGLFLGDVDARYGTQQLKAQELRYFEDEGRIAAQGSVVYRDRGLTVKGPRAQLFLEADGGEFIAATYLYSPHHAGGSATKIYRKSADVLALENATYTTCDLGSPDWFISSKDVTLDRALGDGTAKHAVLRFKHVPFLYTPWIRFPIDDRRKSGFLPPTFGSTSTSGTEIVVPYYYNMAPNRDATFSLRYLFDRGLQLQTDFRYLYPSSKGDVDADSIRDRKTGTTRYLFSLKNSSTIVPRLFSTTDFNIVSDRGYLEDFGNSLSQTSLTHLDQRLDFTYVGDFWNVLTRVQAFQTVDRTVAASDRPYARLPQLLFNARLPDQALGLGYGLRGEWVRFDRDPGPTGHRLETTLDIDRPFVRPGYYAIPSAKLRFTSYELFDVESGVESSPRRALPLVSFDSGLIFERRSQDGKAVQTIEPRIYYLFVPFRDQADIPVFDTTELDFTFSQLFRDNRFVGGDRVGDANQLTAALTARWLDTRSAQENLSASVGQIYFFEDREVSLRGQSPRTSNSSNIVAELAARIATDWSLRGTTRWDPLLGDFDRASARLRYKKGTNRVVNLGYSFRREELEQTDVAFAWPLGRQWLAVGRWNYDLEEDQNLEILGGLEYDSCCWKARVVARRFVNSTAREFNTSIEVQLVLKGLTRIGSGLDEVLERGILGFEAED